jgi:hypothetical protein
MSFIFSEENAKRFKLAEAPVRRDTPIFCVAGRPNAHLNTQIKAAYGATESSEA